MDKRLNKKVEQYRFDFIAKIKDKAAQLELEHDDKTRQLMQFIFDYERLSFTKDDFHKRKRVKNHVHAHDRCCARRANDEQCTRRKKEGEEFCGTHSKGCPNGVVAVQTEEERPNFKKIEVWTQDIKGIMYYIDANHNVYDTTDIIQNRMNPRIIAKYSKVGDVYGIPEFRI